MPTIRELREQRGWSQVELAYHLKVAPSTVYAWERGLNEPRLTVARRIAEVFGISTDDIDLVERGGE